MHCVFYFFSSPFQVKLECKPQNNPYRIKLKPQPVDKALLNTVQAIPGLGEKKAVELLKEFKSKNTSAFNFINISFAFADL
jgi:ERCC4-type nuclease